jgi:hypothetical protein
MAPGDELPFAADRLAVEPRDAMHIQLDATITAVVLDTNQRISPSSTL